MKPKPLTGNQRAFLAAYAELGTITHAARAAKIDRRQVFRWVDNPTFADAFAEAKQEACDALEREARRRAIEGVDKPVFQGGQKVGTIREYSDTLLIFTMKGAMPDKYRERVTVVTEDAVDAEIRRLERELGGRAQAGQTPPAQGPPS